MEVLTFIDSKIKDVCNTEIKQVYVSSKIESPNCEDEIDEEYQQIQINKGEQT